MRIVMTLVCRDEEDILDAMLSFHLNAGVDFVLVTDHGSTDATPEILDRYVRAGHAHVTRVETPEYRQSEWVTRMARRAATDHGADWVLNSDADEFWWPRGRDLKDVLEHVPARYGTVWAVWRFFVPQLEPAGFFAERMTLRLSPSAPINSASSPFRPTAKIAHRADPGVSVGMGNHELSNTRLIPLRGWYPIELLHFPLRRRDQVVRKYAAVRDALTGARTVGGHITRIVDAASEGWVDEILESLGAAPETAQEGVESGVLVRDTRLRDVLRGLAGIREPTIGSAGSAGSAGNAGLAGHAGQTFPLPGEETALMFPRPTVVEDVRFAVETAVLAEADQVRAIRRLDELEGRLTELERRPGARLVRAARRIVRRNGKGDAQ